MQLLVLRVAAIHEVRVLPLVVEDEVARQSLEHRAALAETGDAMIDRGVHDARPRDEAAARAEVFVDAGEHVAHPELLAVAREDSFPERSEERRVGKECRSRWSPYH